MARRSKTASQWLGDMVEFLGLGAIQLSTPDPITIAKGKELQWGDDLTSITVSVNDEWIFSQYNTTTGFLFISDQNPTPQAEVGSQGAGSVMLMSAEDSARGSHLRIWKNRGGNYNAASTQVGDQLGAIDFTGFDSADLGEASTYSDTDFAQIEGYATNVTDGSSAGRMVFKVLSKDSFNSILTLSGSANTISIGTGKHIIAMDQDIRYADSSDNTVIVELPGVKIPAHAIITSVAAVVKTGSDLTTHKVNIQISATSGTGANSSISSGTELLGAGVTNTDSSDSASAEDIDLSDDVKEVWVCRDTVRNTLGDAYVYICNAGTGNGTTSPEVGTLTVIIEYYGLD